MQCIGVQYAFMHLTATLGTASVLMNWEHERTKDSDEIQVVAAYVHSLPSQKPIQLSIFKQRGSKY
jgi:cytochrome P450